MKPRILISKIALFVLTAVTVQSHAAFPDQPIRFVVGFPPGGSTDMVARIMAEGMSQELKQPVVVENKPGAGGTIAAGLVAQSKPDGYTIFLGTVATNVINPLLRKKMSFDPIKDFTMIGEVGFYTNLIMVNPNSEFKDLNSLINKAKSSTLSYSSPGPGTSPHMTGEFFRLLTQTHLQHIPFSGSGPALTALMGGHVDISVDNLPAALELVKSGKVKALAITSVKRIRELPDVPTAEELGVKGMSVDAWVSIMGPAGIPKDRLDILSNALLKTLQKPDIVAKLEGKAITIKGTTPSELQAYIESETSKWKKVVESAEIKID